MNSGIIFASRLFLEDSLACDSWRLTIAVHLKLLPARSIDYSPSALPAFSSSTVIIYLDKLCVRVEEERLIAEFGLATSAVLSVGGVFWGRPVSAAGNFNPDFLLI